MTGNRPAQAEVDSERVTANGGSPSTASPSMVAALTSVRLCSIRLPATHQNAVLRQEVPW